MAIPSCASVSVDKVWRQFFSLSTRVAGFKPPSLWNPAPSGPLETCTVSFKFTPSNCLGSGTYDLCCAVVCTPKDKIPEFNAVEKDCFNKVLGHQSAYSSFEVLTFEKKSSATDLNFVLSLTGSALDLHVYGGNIFKGTAFDQGHIWVYVWGQCPTAGNLSFSVNYKLVE